MKEGDLDAFLELRKKSEMLLKSPIY